MSSGVAALSFAQRLDGSSLTPTQRKVWLLAAMGVLLDGFDFFIIGVGLPLVSVEFGMSPATQGLVAVAAVAGALFGALVFGRIADRFGRRTMLVVDLALFVVGAAASALAWNAASLIAFRFLLGVGIGGDYPLGVSYISESVPARLRPSLIVGAFAFQALGSLLGVVVGLVLLTLHPATDAWRGMLAFGVIPAVIVVIMRQGLPESVPWLLTRKRYADASAAASHLLETAVTLDERDAPSVTHVPSGELFGKYLRNTIFTSLPWLLQDISTYGIGIFTPTVIAALAPAAAGGTWLTRDIGATQGAAIVDVMLVVGFMLAIVGIRYISAVRLQITGFIGMAIGLSLVAAASLASASGAHTALIFGGFMIFNLLMNAGPNATTYLLSGESFPTAIRCSGSGVAAASAKFGAVVGTFFFPILRAQIGLNALLLLLACASLAAAVVTYAARPIRTT